MRAISVRGRFSIIRRTVPVETRPRSIQPVRASRGVASLSWGRWRGVGGGEGMGGGEVRRDGGGGRRGNEMWSVGSGQWSGGFKVQQHFRFAISSEGEERVRVRRRALTLPSPGVPGEGM